MRVQVQRIGITPNYTIHVDGKPWGEVHGTSTPAGMRFIIKDAANRTVRYIPGGMKRAEDYKIKTTHANAKVAMPPVIRRAIDEGNLKDPNTVMAEFNDEAARRQSRTDAATKEKRALWEAKAREALAKVDDATEDDAAAVQAIIEAMEWAQSQ